MKPATSAKSYAAMAQNRKADDTPWDRCAAAKAEASTAFKATTAQPTAGTATLRRFGARKCFGPADEPSIGHTECVWALPIRVVDSANARSRDALPCDELANITALKR